MRSRQEGLTLVEALIGLALIALIAAALSQALFGTLAASTWERDRLELTQAAQQAMERMAMYVRETNQVLEPDAAQPVSTTLRVIDFVREPGEEAAFTWDSATGVLTETGDWGGATLAEEVSHFRVSRASSPSSQPLITIELTLSRGDATVALTTTVMPRLAPGGPEPGPSDLGLPADGDGDGNEDEDD